MKSIHELTTEEAYHLAVNVLGDDLPPIEAIENEDWGRDYVLQRILMHDPAELQVAGIRAEE